MVQLKERRTTKPGSRVRSEGTGERITGISTLVFGIFGAWLFWAPADGVLSIFGWDWNIGEAHTAWGLGLMMLAAVLASIYVALVVTRKTR